MPDQIKSEGIQIKPEELQRAAEFGTRMIPLVLRIREAKDQGKGLSLNHEEVITLVEVLNVLRGGHPDA